MRSIRYLIVPGWHGSPDEHWQSHWQRTLPGSARVEQQDWLLPRREDWVAELQRSIAAHDDPVILVAHSLGSIIAIIGIILAAGLLYLYFSLIGGYSSYGTIGGVMALLFTLWVFNIVLLFGVEIDAEVERARELQGDIAAEDNIQLPPRDTAKVEKQQKVRENLKAAGRDLRAMHNEDNGSGGTEDKERDRDDRSGSTAYRGQ